MPYSRAHTTVQLFEDRAASAPDSPAIVYGDVTLTYAQLDGKANALARALRDRGVRRGDMVPLVMRDSLELPISMIASMKLAAPFLPVDDAWPADRIAALIANVAPKVVLVGARGAAGVSDADTLVVAHAELALDDGADLGPGPTVDDLIYGFYTSGSTGLPKCALNQHLGLLNRFLYMSRRFGDDASNVVLQNSRHVFDSSIWQLLWPLTTGSKVVIPVRDGILDLAQTIEVVARHGVTMTDFVPSIFATLVDMIEADASLVPKLASLRRLLIGGEEISARAIRRFWALLPHVAITNTYGPTECSIGSIFHDVTPEDGDSIPIGYPIDNTYAVVLDDERRPLPAGELGEIYIGGDCMGRGYLGDPEKTSRAFVPNPYPQIPGDTLYRTGDLGFMRGDGNLHFVGRRDHQVKIGGVRIELAEIESVMCAHAAVRDAKVVVHDDEDTKMLVAFVVPRRALDLAQLRTHVERLLPKHSVPRRLFTLDAMPLTPNGKADRKALARMAAERLAGGGAGGRDEDLTDVQKRVKEIWLEVLKCRDVGLDDDFFESGGDSLALQRLALALADRLGAKLALRTIVASPTVRDVASLVEIGRPDRDVVETVDLALEVALDPGLRGAPSEADGPPADVMLTGVTGFVGAHVLHDLLVHTDARVFCLVRARDPGDAHVRIDEALRQHGLWHGDHHGRVVPVAGDLGRPRLGLELDEFERLAGVVDAIVHNGALVNHVLDYRAHRRPNVVGTAEVLRLATTGPTKHVHYVSTLSVFPPSHSFAAEEAPEPWDEIVPVDGYSQSKWVAEKMLARARERGVPSTVYRLGEVMPHSVTGVPSRSGLADALVEACLRLGLAFDSPIRMDYTPVDYVARVVAAVVGRGLRPDGAFHVVHPDAVSFDDMLARFRASTRLDPVGYPEFHREVRRRAIDGDDRMARLLTLLPGPDGPEHEVADRLASLFTDGTRAYATTRAAELRRELGTLWPPLGDAVFDARVAQWRRRKPAGRCCTPAERRARPRIVALA
ncbi:MAG TPA: amino acid adenylation domain-containing protein [Actinomycetota bacterium]|nr:amino acid adenylation domain-containing protein [Actinomycetota bacterium]